MYKASFTVYADEVVYDGEHDPNEEICCIKWCIADLLDLMAYKGIELSDENIDRLLDSERFVRVLKDRSIEEGWEILSTLIDLEF